MKKWKGKEKWKGKRKRIRFDWIRSFQARFSNLWSEVKGSEVKEGALKKKRTKRTKRTRLVPFFSNAFTTRDNLPNPFLDNVSKREEEPRLGRPWNWLQNRENLRCSTRLSLKIASSARHFQHQRPQLQDRPHALSWSKQLASQPAELMRKAVRDSQPIFLVILPWEVLADGSQWPSARWGALLSGAPASGHQGAAHRSLGA